MIVSKVFDGHVTRKVSDSVSRVCATTNPLSTPDYSQHIMHIGT